MVICPNCGKENVAGAAFCAFCATPLAEAAVTKERRFITVLFADLVGFTAESDEADPEDVQARLTPYHRRLREEIERYDGTVEKLIGDGVMAVFGVPVAHEDDPERAVRAALRIQEAVAELNAAHEGRDRAVRIGINSGEAVVTTGGEGEHIVGDVVNTASRIESIAPPGGVVVGEATHRATELLIEYEDLAPVEVKGKAKPLGVWRAIEPRGRYGIDAAIRTPTPFLGRDTEMHLLTETFHRVLDDRAIQLVTISAPPGVGKSRLVNEFWRWVDERPEVVWWRQGRNLPYGEGITFWALGEVVKGQAGIRESDTAEEAAAKLSIALESLTADTDREWMAAQLSPLVGAGAEDQLGDRSEAFAAWRRFLEDLADVQPLIMVIEDLHWADDALIEFFRDLLVWSADAPIMVIATTRPELFESHPEWGGGQRNSTTVSLSPLTDDDIAKLLAALLERAVLPADTQHALLDRAGGNPLYAEEFVRMLSDRGMLHGRASLDETSVIPVPETVQGLIGSRLDILSEDESSVIQDAAVVGKVFWHGALAAMGEERDVPRALRQLVERDWIRPMRNSSVVGEREYAFWHSLTRDVAYGRIPREDRSIKHRTVAEWIEATAGDRASDHAEMLADHYTSALTFAEASGLEDASLRSEAIRTLVMAGDRARTLDAQQAYRYYDKALTLMGDTASRRPEVLIKAGRAIERRDRSAVETEFYQEAYERAMADGDRLMAGYAMSLYSSVLRYREGVDAGAESLAEAISLLESEPPSKYLVAAYLELAAGYMLQGELDAQLDWAERGLALADRLGLDEMKARALSVRGVGSFDSGDVEAGMADLRQSVEIVDALPSRGRMWLTAYVNLADYTRKGIGPAQAQEIYEHGIEVAEKRGTGTAWAEAETMWPLFDLGRWDDALAVAEGLLEDRSPLIRAWAQSTRAQVLEWRGAHAEAAALAAEYLPRLREIMDMQQLGPALLIAARTALTEGEVAEAIELIDEFGARTEEMAPLFRGLNLPEAVRLLATAGEVGRAVALVDFPHAAGLRLRLNLDTAKATLTEATGDTEAAIASYDRLAEAWASYGHPLEQALARYGAGRCLVALGRTGEAVERFDAARAILSRLGAQPIIDEIDGVTDAAAAL
jgi:class 3 adenylate cyclase/tetratricopeptide (TPR) repeat protein